MLVDRVVAEEEEKVDPLLKEVEPPVRRRSFLKTPLAPFAKAFERAGVSL